MSNQDYINEEIENVIMKKYSDNFFWNHNTRLIIKNNSFIEPFFRLSLRFMKYFKLCKAPRSFKKLKINFNTMKKKKLLSIKEIKEFKMFIKKLNTLKLSFIIYINILNVFDMEKKYMYEILKIQQELNCF